MAGRSFNLAPRIVVPGSLPRWRVTVIVRPSFDVSQQTDRLLGFACVSSDFWIPKLLNVTIALPRGDPGIPPNKSNCVLECIHDTTACARRHSAVIFLESFGQLTMAIEIQRDVSLGTLDFRQRNGREWRERNKCDSGDSSLIIHVLHRFSAESLSSTRAAAVTSFLY
ncbi:hypothetical protein B0H12DRAFT_1109628 [Mycena haematopus]|nr:hypothetical protein B0H12DRAFT_1109628 [Mycena haematopus]